MAQRFFSEPYKILEDCRIFFPERRETKSLRSQLVKRTKILQIAFREDEPRNLSFQNHTWYSPSSLSIRFLSKQTVRVPESKVDARWNRWCRKYRETFAKSFNQGKRRIICFCNSIFFFPFSSLLSFLLSKRIGFG